MNDLPATRDDQTRLPAAAPAPNALAQLLGDPDKLKDFPVDTVERLFALDREMRKDRAEQEFAEAFNAVQADMTPVRKLAKNSQTGSMYALAEHVDAMLQPLLVRHGFSMSGSASPCDTPDTVRFMLTVRHIGGHSEQHYMDAPIDNVGMKGAPTKTKLHGTGSAETYALRRLKCSVFDVRLVADDDGNRAGGVGPGTEPISQAQIDEINALSDEVGADKQRFCSYFKIGAVPELRAAQFRQAITMLQGKRQ